MRISGSCWMRQIRTISPPKPISSEPLSIREILRRESTAAEARELLNPSEIPFFMTQPVLSRSVMITNPQGIHARPADLFVRTANQFSAHIALIKDGERVDGKSILGILTLAAEQGSRLFIEAHGVDAEKAVETLARLVEQGFEE
jgi:phosphocarrier protein HPr